MAEVLPACPYDLAIEYRDSKAPASYRTLAAGFVFETPRASEAGWLEEGWALEARWLEGGWALDAGPRSAGVSLSSRSTLA